MNNYNLPKNFRTANERYSEINWTSESFGYEPIGFRRQDSEYKKDFFESKLYNTNKPVLSLDINGTLYLIPPQLSDIVFSIEASKVLLELEEDWDGNEAEKIDPTVWSNAVVFLITYSKYILDNFSTIIKSPEINPCRNGSIDLAWRTKNARLLINIKPNGSPVLASYYGDMYDNKQAIKNPIEDNSIIEHLAFWMKNLA